MVGRDNIIQVVSGGFHAISDIEKLVCSALIINVQLLLSCMFPHCTNHSSDVN